MAFFPSKYLYSPRQTFVPQTSITFVSKASVDTGTVQTYKLRKRIEVIKNCRNIGKRDMKYNMSMPKMKVDPETYVSSLVTFDDERADAYGCKSRSSKQMDWCVKRTLPENCRWPRRTMSIEGVEHAGIAGIDKVLKFVCLQDDFSMIWLAGVYT